MTSTDAAKRIAAIVLLAATIVGCAPSGPVEILDDIEETDETSCFRAATCLERGLEAQARGRFGEALPDLAEACERGLVDGCRHLATNYAIGSLGRPDPDRAASLYRWGCTEADDGASCHGLGELHRLQIIDGDTTDARRYFSMACDLGDPAGCHDEAVTWIENAEPDDERQQRAVDAFADACDQGLGVGCVNRAYMQAAGRGIGRDHGEAADSFSRACNDDRDDWSPHHLASITPDTERDVYAVAEYHPEIACQQLEVLTVGRYEDRIIAAVDAETEMLRSCYDDARPPGERAVGRLTIEAGVDARSDGVGPEIVDDELRIADVRDCVKQMLSRHLEDRAGGAAEYRDRWGISFVHPPDNISMATTADGGQACDREAIRHQVGEVFPALRRCGTRHLEHYPDDPGAVVALWTMAPSGTVDDIAMNTTTDSDDLLLCLRETIHSIEIPAFDNTPCPVQVPFLFSEGHQLHFSIVGSDP